MNEYEQMRSRLEALESMAAYQERTIAELNDVITAQWRKIDHLERKLGKLEDDMQSIAAPARSLPEPPPPHY